MKTVRFLIFMVLLFTAGCTSSKQVIPGWVHQKLLAADRGGESFEEVWIYEYQGKTVYYFIPPCCDRFTELYHASGRLWCKPSGGITGRGDGECKRFFEQRKNGRLLWKPKRQID
jgi:hypothetical protein